MVGVILYGPPASGKDTVNAELEQLNTKYRQFPRIKVGPGRTAGYRIATQSKLDELRSSGDVIWENSRYGSTYVVDRSELSRMLTEEFIPVVHLGQPEAVAAIVAAYPNARWVSVYLRCPRDVAEKRIIERGTGDVTARLRAWEETSELPNADITIDTAQVKPSEAAEAIDARVREP